MKDRLHILPDGVEREVRRFAIDSRLCKSFESLQVVPQMFELVEQCRRTNIDPDSQKIVRDHWRPCFPELARAEFLSELDNYNPFVGDPPSLKSISEAHLINV